MANKLEEINETYVKKCFAENVHCSQIVFAAGVDDEQMDPDMARKIGTAFGAGMWRGQTCGAVTGALMALGSPFGYSDGVDSETSDAFIEKKNEFEPRFREKYGSLLCKEVTGLDPSVPEDMEKIMDTQIWFKLCPSVVTAACEILKDILEEYE